MWQALIPVATTLIDKLMSNGQQQQVNPMAQLPIGGMGPIPFGGYNPINAVGTINKLAGNLPYVPNNADEYNQLLYQQQMLNAQQIAANTANPNAGYYQQILQRKPLLDQGKIGNHVTQLPLM